MVNGEGGRGAGTRSLDSWNELAAPADADMQIRTIAMGLWARGERGGRNA